MSHQLSDSRTIRAGALEGALVETSSRPDRYQNDHGDIVVPAGLGEIVLLPRLWDFELVGDSDGTITLTSRMGLVATADLTDSETATVSEVTTRPSAVGSLLDASAP